MVAQAQQPPRRTLGEKVGVRLGGLLHQLDALLLVVYADQVAKPDRSDLIRQHLEAGLKEAIANLPRKQQQAVRAKVAELEAAAA